MNLIPMAWPSEHAAAASTANTHVAWWVISYKVLEPILYQACHGQSGISVRASSGQIKSRRRRFQGKTAAKHPLTSISLSTCAIQLPCGTGPELGSWWCQPAAGGGSSGKGWAKADAEGWGLYLICESGYHASYLGI